MSQSADNEQVKAVSFRHAVGSDIGKRRAENQDAHSFRFEKNSQLFLVCDGMGGARGGATASSLAANIIIRRAFTAELTISEESLRGGIELANGAIFEASRGDENLAGMGTTIVAVAFFGEKVIIAHVGDSRIYRLRRGDFEQLTRDHTLVQELVETGAIAPEEAASHPIAHMLTRSLGPAGAVEIDVRTVDESLQAGDVFLLCCDGLYNMVSDREIADILSDLSPEEAVSALIDLANERGGTDNITVQIIEVLPQGDKAAVAIDGQMHLSTEIPAAELDRVIALGEASLSGGSQAEQTGIEGESGEPAPPTGPPAQAEAAAALPEESAAAVPPASVGPVTETAAEQALSNSEVTWTEADRSLKKTQYVFLFAIAFVLAAAVSYFIRSKSPVEVANRSVSVPTTTEKQVSVTEAPVTTAAESKTVAPSTTMPASPVSSTSGAALPPVVAPNREPASETKTPPETPRDSELLAQQEIAPEPLHNPVDDELHDVAKVVALASRLDVGEPPPIASDSGKSVPDQPIVWEHEKIVSAKLTVPSGTPTVTTSTPKILTEGEKLETIQKKVEIREKIADIDAKVKAFSFSSKDEAKSRADELEDQLKDLQGAIQKTQVSLDTAKRRYQLWSERRKLLETVEPAKLAEEVSLSSVAVKRKKEAYEVASLRYLDVLELWRENPSDALAASKMAALGRELKSRRFELEETLKEAVQQGLSQSEFDISEFGLVLGDLDRRKERLNRHVGFARAFIPTGDKTRVQSQRTLLDERVALKSELEDLKLLVSDESEVELRRGLVLKKFLSRPA